MRRLNLAILIGVVLTLTACKREKHAEPVAVLQSAIEMNDPAVANQLVAGFHGVEAGSWRWTQRTFSVILKPPDGSAQSGARLHFKFSIADSIANNVGPIELTASINGMPLGPERYAKVGNYDYTRDVPLNLLTGPSVRIDFVCDKALEPSGGDVRELALVAHSASLEPKGSDTR